MRRDSDVLPLVFTLFAGFDLSFSNILRDCCLVARPLILGRPGASEVENSDVLKNIAPSRWCLTVSDGQ